MTEPIIPVLQKPPGYRDPNAPPKPVPKLPDRKHVLPHSYRPEKKTKRRRCFRIFCCYFCCFLFMFVILVSITFGLFFLWYEPKLPVFHLQSFKINRFNITVKSEDTYLDSEMAVKIGAKNPNGKIMLMYSGIHASVTVGDGTGMGSAKLTGFTQGKQNTTSLKFVTRVKSVLPSDTVGSKLKAQHRSRNLVVFVEARTRVRFGVERWKVGSVPINVKCGGVSLKKLDHGDMPKCAINLLKWISIH